MTVVRERTVRVAGLRIHVREAGEGEPVLMINGLGGSTAWWNVFEHACPGVRLIQFDAPGTGRSQTPLLPPAIAALGWVAEQVLDRLGIERADVLGYSLGGTIAQELTLRAPERVRRLVLVATTCGWGGVPAPLPLVANVATPLRYWSPSFYERTLPGMAGGRTRTDPAFIALQSERRFAHPPSTLGYMWQIVALSAWTSLPRLPRIRQPTLVVTGDDDPLMPPVNAYLLARRIAGARLLVAPGEGHLLLMDADSAVLDPITSFLCAERVDDASGWRAARTVAEADLDEAFAATGRSLQPMRVGGALLRRLWPAAPSLSAGSARRRP